MLAFVGAVMSETIGANSGLGRLMVQAGRIELPMPLVFACLLGLAVEGIAIYALFAFPEAMRAVAAALHDLEVEQPRKSARPSGRPNRRKGGGVVSADRKREEAEPTIARDIARCLDPASIAFDCGLTLDPWQADLMRSTTPGILMLCARQVGVDSLERRDARERALRHARMELSERASQPGPLAEPVPDQSKRALGGGRPSCLRLSASSCHVSPRAASRSLMWPSGRFKALREFTRLVLGGHPKIIEKLPHNFAATLNFLSVGRSSGLNAYLALGLDRNAIGARCFGIHSFNGCVRMRTALPLIGQCLYESDSDFNPIRHGHTVNLELYASVVQSPALTDSILPPDWSPRASSSHDRVVFKLLVSCGRRR